MARDHRQLRVFHEAHQLIIAIYQETRNFPRDEWFGIRAQMRRAAVSIASNMVEGSARRGVAEYGNFLNLGYLSATAGQLLQRKCDQLIPQLESLIQKVDLLRRAERGGP